MAAAVLLFVVALVAGQLASLLPRVVGCRNYRTLWIRMWCESVARSLPLPARGCVPIDKLPVRPPLSRNPSCPVTTEPLSMSLSMSGSWGGRAMGLPERETFGTAGCPALPLPPTHSRPVSHPRPSTRRHPPRTHSLTE